jgi:hypothetical protein
MALGNGGQSEHQAMIGTLCAGSHELLSSIPTLVYLNALYRYGKHFAFGEF